MRISSAFICLLFCAAPALAAAQIPDALAIGLSPSSIAPSDCGDTVQITVTATQNDQPVTGLEGDERWSFGVSDRRNCDDAVDVDLADVVVGSSQGTYRTTARARDLFEAVDDGNCSDVTGRARVYVCVFWDDDEEQAVATFTVDTTAPDAPTLERVRSGDRKLRLSFLPAGSTSPDAWEVCYRAIGSTDASMAALGTMGVGAGGAGGEGGMGGAAGAGGAGGVAGAGGAGGAGGTAGAGGAGGTGTGGAGGEGGTGGAGGEGGTGGAGGEGGGVGVGRGDEICSDGSVRTGIAGSRRSYELDGLRNGTTYEIAVRAVNEAGNASAASNVLEGTPYAVDRFCDVYEDAGGDCSPGGCASAAGPASIGLLLSALFLSRRFYGRR